MARQRGWTLVEVLVAVMALLIVAILVIPGLAQVSRRNKVALCIGNLQALHRAQAAHPSSDRLGMEYWTRLAATIPPAASPETLRCPLVELPKPPPCLYLGPRTDPGGLGSNVPIGCDLDTNHSPNGRQGGNVLLKSGEVITEKGDGGLWMDTRSKHCRP